MTIPRAISTRTMDVGARNWTRKTARENYWRVAAWISMDDLLQDGELCWAIVRRRYDATPPHLMALFKRTFINHLHDLANSRTLQTELPFAALTDLAVEEALDSKTCPFAEMLRLVTEAPSRVNNLLEHLLADPSALRKAYRRQATAIETTNERLCEVSGLDPVTVDLHTAVRRSLTR
jgi:hypothetical protein